MTSGRRISTDNGNKSTGNRVITIEEVSKMKLRIIALLALAVGLALMFGGCNGL